MLSWLNFSRKERKVKVLLPYKHFDGNICTETIWCERKGNGYEVNNIPFYASNVALGDLIEVKEIDGDIWFEKLLKPSGNSVIQLVIYDHRSQAEVGKLFEQYGCDWEGSDRSDLISINVPYNVPYNVIKEILIDGENREIWDYREACLGWK